jgi:hypothetical protein
VGITWRTGEQIKSCPEEPILGTREEKEMVVAWIALYCGILAEG